MNNIHIGIIGYGNDSSKRLTEAIKKYLEENSKVRYESASQSQVKRRTLKLNK